MTNININEYIFNLPKYKEIIKDITSSNKQNIYIESASANISKMLAFCAYNTLKQNILYVCTDTYEAFNAYERIASMLGEDNVSFYPVEEFISGEMVASSTGFRLARMQTLFNICENNPKLIITSSEGVSKITLSKEKLSAATLKLYIGQIIKIKELTINLINRGYKKVSLVESVGTFSVRGSLIDIYPINQDNVIRINFFDDEIESIKIVDVETQRSIEHINNIFIFPLYNIYYDEEEIPTIIDKINKNHTLVEKVKKDIEKIKDYEALDQLGIYIPYIDEHYLTFIELCTPKLVFYENITSILDHETMNLVELAEYYNNIGFNYNEKALSNIRQAIKENPNNIFFNPNNGTLNDVFLNKLYNIHTLNNFSYNNNFRNLIEDIKINKNKTYIITHEDDKKIEFIKDAFNQNDIAYNYNKIVEGEVNVIVQQVQYGFVDTELNLEVITPNEYSPGKVKRKAKFAKYYKYASKVYSKDDLKIGDYVIHQDYGIGIYRGIETRETRGKLIDYVYIQYAEETRLLIPVENLYLIEKYNCTSDLKLKLNNLNSKEWSKKKEKVKEKVLEMAKRLLKVQAERALLKGFVYGKDTKEQIEFENDFGFTETKDQLDAINSVKQDMESDRPLDRLICGDVGFGKTEVAMRAAFKAISSGKQVAYLAPTTVLSRQHYYTFKERFEKFGAKVVLLNRFVSAKEQKKILEGITSGYIDIIIGTHRILSKDLIFKDLGLLIIDEEQRFGVMHKERIKEMKTNIDVLTLTATPIPRTLQMSLSGLRDLSLIQTPPQNRFPIQTYVLESNDSVIREAINRELGRGGQVFYLLNRIAELDNVKRKIFKLCPQAKIGIIHGQLEKETIEEELINFLNGDYDVLICTTIIETGIDIPNANTIIIEKADILGLAQLYQIRGRVGRSDRIAYAYLMYDPIKTITDEAKKRLDAIKEFTSLGSGYKIAMRDLSIRGAGDILGSEQSGFINAVGIELYSSMLEEAIDELKGTIKQKEEKTLYNISVNKHIDEKYLPDDEIRLKVHKEINRISTRDMLNEKINEFTDRYGTLSEDILIYMEEKYLEHLMKKKGIESLKEKNNEIVVTFSLESTNKIKFKELRPIVLQYAPKFEFNIVERCLVMYIKPSDYERSYIFTLTKFLEQIDI